MAIVQSSILPHIDPIAFWSHVKRCRHGMHCRRCCWPWRLIPPGRYGQIRIAGQRYLVHHVALELTDGALLLPGVFVCHTCDYSPCCNPHHLYPGTDTDNKRDMGMHGSLSLTVAQLQQRAKDDAQALQEWLRMTATLDA